MSTARRLDRLSGVIHTLGVFKDRYLRWIQLVAFLAIAAIITHTLATAWPSVVASLGTIGPVRILIATATLLFTMTFQGISWFKVLQALTAAPITLRAGLRIFTISGLGKYVPGSVWPAVIQSEMGVEFGIARKLMFSAFSLQLLLSLGTAGVLSAFVILGRIPNWAVASLMVMSISSFAVVISLVLPSRLFRLINRLFTWLSKRDLPPILHYRRMSQAFVWTFASWILSGVQLWSLSEPLGVDSSQLLYIIGVGAMSWVAGTLVLFIPSGAGVREAFAAAALSTVIGPAQALTIAVLSRFTQIVADLVTTGIFGGRHLVVSIKAIGTTLISDTNKRS